MTRNRFDQASRYAAKLDPVGFLRWLFGVEVVPFRLWLDTRTLPFPGDPERTCDTVACLDAGPEAEPFAVAVEFSLEPDALMFGRMLVYLGQLWLEMRPNGQRGRRFQIAAAIVHLTGEGHASRDMRLAGFGMRTCLDIVERDMAREDAAATLERITAGTVARCLLPWIPLMRGGGEVGNIDRWKELALVESDGQRRGEYGGLARVFAEATEHSALWNEALRGWNMRDSQVVAEWITEGKIEGKVGDILRLLEKRFPPGAPTEVAATIKASTNIEQLNRWFDAAIDAASLDEFRQAM